MENEFEENAYFKQVIKDALKELKQYGICYVFFEEQVEAIKQILELDDIEVSYDGYIYYLTLPKKYGKIK